MSDGRTAISSKDGTRRLRHRGGASLSFAFAFQGVLFVRHKYCNKKLTVSVRDDGLKKEGEATWPCHDG